MCSTGHYHLTGCTTLLGREIPKVADNMYAKDVRQPRGNYRTCRVILLSGNMRLTPLPLGAADYQVIRADNCELLQYNMLKL